MWLFACLIVAYGVYFIGHWLLFRREPRFALTAETSWGRRLGRLSLVVSCACWPLALLIEQLVPGVSTGLYGFWKIAVVVIIPIWVWSAHLYTVMMCVYALAERAPDEATATRASTLLGLLPVLVFILSVVVVLMALNPDMWGLIGCCASVPVGLVGIMLTLAYWATLHGALKSIRHVLATKQRSATTVTATE